MTILNREIDEMRRGGFEQMLRFYIMKRINFAHCKHSYSNEINILYDSCNLLRD